MNNDKIININSITSKLNEEEKNYRQKVMDEILKTNMPYSPIDEKEIEISNRLIEKNVIDTIPIKSIYPISAIKTDKKVILKNTNRVGYAMCGIDALGFFYTFNEPIEIVAECAYSKKTIIINIDKDGNIVTDDKDIVFLYKDLNKSNTWSCCCCNIMHIFNDKDSFDKWCDLNLSSLDDIYCLNLEEANKLSKNLFS